MASNPPNPNGSNGTTSDPREQVMWDIYITKLANGIDNAYESAIEAGYEPSSAKNIRLREWFKERYKSLERKEMLSDAEKVLRKAMRYSVEKIDDEGNVKILSDVLRIQTDVAKHLTSTLGKDKGYSTRVENTGKDGEQINLGVVLLPTRNTTIEEPQDDTGL